MLRSLRGRLIISHTLPMLIVIPLMGLALVYVLETGVLLSNLADELAREAALVAQVAPPGEDIWHDRAEAEAFVQHLGPGLDSRLMILDAQGNVLASSDGTTSVNTASQPTAAALAEALRGRTGVASSYSRSLDTDVADVFYPALDDQGQLLGVIRLTHRLNGVVGEFVRLRYLVAAVLAVGLLLGAGVGWLLAVNIARPLRSVTGALKTLASEGRPAPLPGSGPEEVREMVGAYNSVVTGLRAAQESRKQLLANVVHELGRPLGALRSAVQALERGAEEDPALRRDLVGGIDLELARLQRTLDDLARLYDLLRGEVPIVYQTTNLTEWLPRTLAPWRRAAQAKGLRWHVELPPTLPAIELDPDRLAQAIGNLLSNAIRYTPSGGEVGVDAGATGGAIWVRVSDTGPGIPAEEQAGIFHAFYRGRTAGRFPDGMGLGLTIAYDLVSRHGGRLELQSEPGAGSRFTIILPLVPPSL